MLRRYGKHSFGQTQSLSVSPNPVPQLSNLTVTGSGYYPNMLYGLQVRTPAGGYNLFWQNTHGGCGVILDPSCGSWITDANANFTVCFVVGSNLVPGTDWTVQWAYLTIPSPANCVVNLFVPTGPKASLSITPATVPAPSVTIDGIGMNCSSSVCVFPYGGVIQVRGSGFTPNGQAKIQVDSLSSGPFTIDGNGNFTGTFSQYFTGSKSLSVLDIGSNSKSNSIPVGYSPQAYQVSLAVNGQGQVCLA